MTGKVLSVVFFIFFYSIGAGQIKKSPASRLPVARQRSLTDSALLDIVQKQTFHYFWDFAHPVCNMARETSNLAYEYGDQTVAVGGTGFGIMSVIVATNRKWIGRDTAAKFLLRMVNFLLKAKSYHGVFPHFMNGTTGATIPFTRKDDGADLVETSYLFEGLLCARQYFNQDNAVENELRNHIGWMWNDIEWDWFTKGGEKVLYWHWSPNNDWAMNAPIRGFNECLITYVLAASGEHYPIDPDVYHLGWTQSSYFKNGKTFYGYKLPLGFDYGGPLFFSHYSFLGLDPRGLKDRYADYWEQNLNHTLINHAYCIDNPQKFKGYGENCWGLTASNTYYGYDAHSPTNDHGTITPSGALSAFPYTPEFSMKALKHFYYDLGDRIWSKYGFVDAFNETKNWQDKFHLAIDQGPIIVMIENYRTGLLWKLFMSCPEVKKGLLKLGFESPYLADVDNKKISTTGITTLVK
jgi:hypothetical protein